MAQATPKKTAARVSAKKPAPPPPAAVQRAAAPANKPPAYLQAKLAVSHPQDSAEREADHVARQVMRAAKESPAVTPAAAPKVQRASLEPAITPEKKETLALKPVPAAQAIQRRAQPAAEDKVQRDAADSAGDTMAGASVDSSLESRIEARRGSGSPLPPTVAAEMAARFNRDFDSVRIHSDREAADLCAQTNARAFNVGNDIFFAPGEFAPETDGGKELLAHELTHVVQQEGGASGIQRVIEPNPEVAPLPPAPPTPDGNSRRKLDAISTLPLPQNKARHVPLYQAWKQAGRLKRLAGYDRQEPDQVSLWNQNTLITPEAFNTKLRRRGIPEATAASDVVRIKIGNRVRSYTRNEWLYDYLRKPEWDRNGRNQTFQVDHMVELQVSGEHGEGVGNSLENLELFDAESNTSSGRTLKNAMRARVREYQESLPAAQRHSSTSAWLRDYSIVFERVIVTDEGSPQSQSAWWTHREITNLDSIDLAEAAAPVRLEGTSERFVLASGRGGVVIGRFPREPAGARAITVDPDSSAAKRLAGFKIRSINLAANIGAETPAGGDAGSMACEWDLPEQFQPTNPAVTIPLLTIGELHAAAVGPVPALAGNFAPLSPFSFDSVSVRDNELYAEGTILPSLPLLANCRLALLLRGDDVMLAMVVPLSSLQLELPAVAIQGGTLLVFYSRRNGFGIEGAFDFTISHLGNGEVEAQYTQERGFELLGSFAFDSKLFDQNSVSLWYRGGLFGMAGSIGISSPDKVRGIRSANLQMSYEAGRFNAVGTVEPDIPGVQQAGLRVDYAEETGLTIGGNLQLAPNPAIRSGSINVTVRKIGEDWKVAASGSAQPAIPGIESQLTVSYDDGAFSAEFSGAYARGMLSGNATVGVTNRSLGPDGQPTGAAAPEAPLIVYGSGAATVRLAPWLQGTAGLRLDPNGEVTISGEIGLPSALEIFSRKPFDKRLFGMSAQIPIFPGIVAEVGGNLSASASIGPGVLDQLRLGIVYNPSHEENTHVYGDAHLNIPAEAGLRLAARAGVGVSIFLASATGGIELGGTLGIAGAAEASVHIDWMPSTGLGIDAEGYVHAEPKFKFDVSGYVDVSALGISVYDERWELAAYELGSNLRFGVRFPIHYREGQPFDISLDDVQFEVPPVDPESLLSDLGERIF